MTTVTIHQTKTHLSKLINRVLSGEEIVVLRGRDPESEKQVALQHRQLVGDRNQDRAWETELVL